MAISGDYPAPVTVNGFTCKNCTDVDYARKHIDPAHPRDGPYGVNARDSASAPAVRFGGALAGRIAAGSAPASPTAQGARLDVRV